MCTPRPFLLDTPLPPEQAVQSLRLSLGSAHGLTQIHTPRGACFEGRVDEVDFDVTTLRAQRQAATRVVGTIRARGTGSRIEGQLDEKETWKALAIVLGVFAVFGLILHAKLAAEPSYRLIFGGIVLLYVAMSVGFPRSTVRASLRHVFAPTRLLVGRRALHAHDDVQKPGTR